MVALVAKKNLKKIEINKNKGSPKAYGYIK